MMLCFCLLRQGVIEKCILSYQEPILDPNESVAPAPTPPQLQPLRSDQNTQLQYNTPPMHAYNDVSSDSASLISTLMDSSVDGE